VIDSKLRHPLERPLLIIYVTLNFAVLAAAILIALQGADWLNSHPVIAKYRTHVRTLALVAVFSPFAVAFTRNLQCAEIRGNSLLLSSRQLPQLHQILLRHCAVLKVNPPELYFSDSLKEPARTYSAWKKEYIVLGANLLQPDLTPILPIFSFLIGRELGSLKLGHASWLSLLLLTYIRKIPYLRNPLLRVFVYSEDRFGAYLTPDGIQGLVVLATGRLMLPSVNTEEYLAHVRRCSGLWSFMSEFATGTPPVARRIHVLLQAGFFQTENPTPFSV
jgi:hypothetical protein